jgi:hypothetical protein
VHTYHKRSNLRQVVRKRRHLVNQRPQKAHSESTFKTLNLTRVLAQLEIE